MAGKINDQDLVAVLADTAPCILLEHLVNNQVPHEAKSLLLMLDVKSVQPFSTVDDPSKVIYPTSVLQIPTQWMIVFYNQF